MDFEFDSELPKCTIKKVVGSSPQNANGTTYFNLGIGDLTLTTDAISYLKRSNNRDNEKILSTIACIILTVLTYALKRTG
ncbi:DUF6934 family protein [Sphingobacterium alkalisoli]|uniref:DUF6934 family protein n=1 Tax=Sphingobacterium alkalisoli TaxID=1874115 RepID=UPI003570984B